MKFEPRLTAPSGTDRNWINTAYGGNNRAYVINRNTGSVLANCVGYVNGRANELMGGKDAGLCVWDADQLWGYTSDGYPRSQTPALGAILCWSCPGKKGHVATVEAIYDDGTVLASQSNYAGTVFYTKRFNPHKWPSGYVFQGYVCPDYHFETITPVSELPVKLKIGYASSGDISTIKHKLNELLIGFTEDAGYLYTSVEVSKGDQIAILELCLSLGVPCVEWVEADDKDARIAELEKELAASEANVEELSSEIDSLNHQIDALTVEFNTSKATVCKQKEKIDGAVEVLTA